MCGIAGRFNFRTGAPVDHAVLANMCDLLAHRGPDASGVWTDGAVGFGHRRLAVVDLSAAGRQPMQCDDASLVITFNGEIYNFLELKRELEGRGHRFQTATDTEVLLLAYREWGQSCLSRLRGMFAFAIWDVRVQTLFVARDRLGKKPLCYSVDGDGISFASEPKAFLADPAFRAEPDLPALAGYLTYQYVPSPLSAFKGVQKLPPGHFLVVADGQVRLQRYWKVSYEPKRGITEDEAADELLARLEDAVRVRLISDVPLGAFLSGGIDSGTIVALMARLGDRPVKTFSIGFEEEEFNELPYARQVASRYGTEHHEFIVKPDALQVLPQLVWHYNEPFADPSAIPSFYLSELARKHVTVALNGDAGDENLAGYRRYIVPSEAARFDSMPPAVRHAITTVMSRVPRARRSHSVGGRFLNRLHGILDTPERRYARRTMVFEPELKAWAFTREFLSVSQASGADELLVRAWNDSEATDSIDAKLSVDMQHYLPDCLLVKVDVATMAYGLEGRSPMLDHTFVEFCASLPTHLKLRRNVTKYLLKRIARSLLPSEIVERPKKGFGVPLARWFRGELRAFTEDLLLDGRLARRGLFRQAAVDQLVREHVTGVSDWNRELWALVMLESWYRMFIDARPVAAPHRHLPAVVQGRS